MKPRLSRVAAVLLALAALAACATVQVNFPASEVAQSAELLVADAFSTRNMVATRAAGTARHVDNVANPAVRAAMESILDRQASLKPFYDSGAVGIGNDGYLAIRAAEGSSAAQAGEAKRLVDEDNADRRKLYAAQAKDLKIKDADLPKVGEIYAQTWRDKALQGWWVQGKDGGWAKK
jgi:uncharacterized protein YdbL (DUF1318 family)